MVVSLSDSRNQKTSVCSSLPVADTFASLSPGSSLCSPICIVCSSAITYSMRRSHLIRNCPSTDVYGQNNFRTPQSPNPLSTGMVRLSSHPNKSTTSLALATSPLQMLTTPSASQPVTWLWSSAKPKESLTGFDRPSAPWNITPSW